MSLRSELGHNFETTLQVDTVDSLQIDTVDSVDVMVEDDSGSRKPKYVFEVPCCHLSPQAQHNMVKAFLKDAHPSAEALGVEITDANNIPLTEMSRSESAVTGNESTHLRIIPSKFAEMKVNSGAEELQKLRMQVTMQRCDLLEKRMENIKADMGRQSLRQAFEPYASSEVKRHESAYNAVSQKCEDINRTLQEQMQKLNERMDELSDRVGKYESTSVKDELAINVSDAAKMLNELGERLLSSEEDLMERMLRLEHNSGFTQPLKLEHSLNKPKLGKQNQLMLNSLRFPKEESLAGDSVQAHTPESGSKCTISITDVTPDLQPCVKIKQLRFEERPASDDKDSTSPPAAVCGDGARRPTSMKMISEKKVSELEVQRAQSCPVAHHGWNGVAPGFVEILTKHFEEAQKAPVDSFGANAHKQESSSLEGAKVHPPARSPSFPDRVALASAKAKSLVPIDVSVLDIPRLKLVSRSGSVSVPVAASFGDQILSHSYSERGLRRQGDGQACAMVERNSSGTSAPRWSSVKRASTTSCLSREHAPSLQTDVDLKVSQHQDTGLDNICAVSPPRPCFTKALSPREMFRSATKSCSSLPHGFVSGATTIQHVVSKCCQPLQHRQFTSS